MVADMCGNMYKLHFIILKFGVLYNRSNVYITNLMTNLNAACKILILYYIFCIFGLFHILLSIW